VRTSVFDRSHGAAVTTRATTTVDAGARSVCAAARSTGVAVCSRQIQRSRVGHAFRQHVCATAVMSGAAHVYEPMYICILLHARTRLQQYNACGAFDDGKAAAHVSVCDTVLRSLQVGCCNSSSRQRRAMLHLSLFKCLLRLKAHKKLRIDYWCMVAAWPTAQPSQTEARWSLQAVPAAARRVHSI
jgi:hypothetical protein